MVDANTFVLALSGLTAVATVCSAIAAICGPIVAARMAERLRKQTASLEQERANRFYIFSTIMQHRATYHYPEAVRAFNSIDVVFSADKDVRDAWRGFFESLDTTKGIPLFERDRRLKELLSRMASSLGIAADFDRDDLSRIYFPEFLAKIEHSQNLQADLFIRNYSAALAANTALGTVSVGTVVSETEKSDGRTSP